jgi:DNA-binding NarL/FixJ family response regulator
VTRASQREDKSSATREINLIIAVESRMDGQLFKHALEAPRQRLKVISCAVSKDEFVHSIGSHSTDIALVSESLQDGHLTGFRILAELRALSPKTRSIMLLKNNNSELVLDAFRAGAKGVFCRTDPLQTLPKCIRAVHGGQVWANGTQLNRVLESLSKTSPLKMTGVAGRRPLTKREDQIVSLTVEGFSNGEIAHKMALTEHMVIEHLIRIYQKLGITSRVELVLCSSKNAAAVRPAGY